MALSLCFLPRSISYHSTCRKIYRHIENSKIESTLMFFHFPLLFFSKDKVFPPWSCHYCSLIWAPSRERARVWKPQPALSLSLMLNIFHSIWDNWWWCRKRERVFVSTNDEEKNNDHFKYKFLHTRTTFKSTILANKIGTNMKLISIMCSRYPENSIVFRLVVCQGNGDLKCSSLECVMATCL